MNLEEILKSIKNKVIDLCGGTPTKEKEIDPHLMRSLKSSNWRKAGKRR